jgi:ribonuclease D
MKASSVHRYEIVDTISGLEDLTRALSNKNTIGIDLEADSMYHFKEKVCLIQVAADNLYAVIDPLQIKDLSVLKPLFRSRDTIKVFHGADYDIRSLFRDFRISVHNLFDTQLACRFLGFRETSLEAVLKRLFRVTLDKKYQRKDWSKRPLPEEMIVYAIDDVRYLVKLAQRLESELDKKDRLSWVREECVYLSRVRPVSNDADPLFLHFKGAGKLDPHSLATLEALLQFRKVIARKKDRPLFKVIRNKSLLQLATIKPKRISQLEKSKILSPKQIQMYGQDIISTIQKALNTPTKDLPEYPRKKAPYVPARVGISVKSLRTWRDTQAKALDIDPALICTNSQISLIAQQNPQNISSLAKINELKQWQRKAFGKDIVAVLRKANGRKSHLHFRRIKD